MYVHFGISYMTNPAAFHLGEAWTNGQYLSYQELVVVPAQQGVSVIRCMNSELCNQREYKKQYTGTEYWKVHNGFALRMG